MFNESDLQKYKALVRIVDQMDWVVKGEAVIQAALLKQWLTDLEKKIAWGIAESKPKPSDLNAPKPIRKKKAASRKKL